MGLLDKVKNLFTEEVEEPIIKKEESKKEIQKQERKIEIAPARRETALMMEEEKEEEVLPKKEEKNLYFSDEDFEDLEKPKEVEEKKEIKEFYHGRKSEIKKEEKKSFRPSPIISPVYGVLDKNYKKDDITSKEVTSSSYRSDKVTVDDIRNKAYGVLEDDLESNLLDNPIVVENEKEEASIDIFEELETREAKNKNLLTEDYEIKDSLSEELQKQKQQIEEINEIIKNTISPDKEKVTSRKIDNILEELDEIEELIPSKEEKDDIKEEIIENDDNIEKTENNLEEKEEIMNTLEENEDNKDELEESDLFNLIDSMYEKRDE